MKLIKEAATIFIIQILFVTVAFSAQVTSPYGIIVDVLFEGGKVSRIVEYWETTTEAITARDISTCPPSTISITDKNDEDKNAMFTNDLWQGYVRECELDTGYKEIYFYLGCVGSICGSEDLQTSISNVTINVLALELIALQALLGFALLWGVRKLVKIMNRS